MTLSVKIPAQSHLSDALIEIDFNPEQAQLRIRFVKWLLIKFDGNLNQNGDIDALWDEFITGNMNTTQTEINKLIKQQEEALTNEDYQTASELEKKISSLYGY